MSEQERDTHFQGFARLLYDELHCVDLVSTVHEADDKVRKEAKEQVIARRAYDLVMHSLHSVPLDPVAISEIPNIPDLTEWPKPE